MATITFHANNFEAATNADASLIDHVEGSGLGFFGGGFGISVPVGSYQDSTWVTNGNGTEYDYQTQNTKYVPATGGSGLYFNGNTVDIGTSGTPNYYAPLNIRFTHDEYVATQNCKLRIFDRNNIARMQSGVTTQVYEIRHPHPTAVYETNQRALAHRGTVNHSWTEYDPVDELSFDLTLTSSPGQSGLNTNQTDVDDGLPSIGDGGFYNWLTSEGNAHTAKRHDWYLALSASPDSIGSKTDYGLYFTLEYL